MGVTNHLLIGMILQVKVTEPPFPQDGVNTRPLASRPGHFGCATGSFGGVPARVKVEEEARPLPGPRRFNACLKLVKKS